MPRPRAGHRNAKALSSPRTRARPAISPLVHPSALRPSASSLIPSVLLAQSLSSDRALDHRLGDLRLLLGAVAVGVALVAQFWPGNHVTNRALLVVCVALYAVLSAVLWALGATVDRDVVARVLPAEVSEAAAAVPAEGRGAAAASPARPSPRGRATSSPAGSFPLVVRSKLPRGTDVYELCLEARLPSVGAGAVPPPVVLSTSVGALVHASGHVSDAAVDAFVRRALDGLEAQAGKKTKGRAKVE